MQAASPAVPRSSFLEHNFLAMAVALTDSSTSLQPDLSERTHSCTFCQAQEIDPNTQIRGHSLDPAPAIVIGYRGSKVVHGASNGCLIFADCLELLDVVLRSHNYDDGYQSANFRAENWIYEMDMCLNGLTHVIQEVKGRWKCVKVELPNASRIPLQTCGNIWYWLHKVRVLNLLATLI